MARQVPSTARSIDITMPSVLNAALIGRPTCTADRTYEITA